MNNAAPKPSFGFSRTCRLTTKADFSAVFDDQLKVSQSWFLALYKKNSHTHPRMGMVISKRVVRMATNRNRLKRLIREGFRAQQTALQNFDIVILARKGCRVDNPVKLQEELNHLWQRLRTV